MVVPEPRVWRTAQQHAARVARAVRPRVVRGARAVAARSARLTTLQLTAGAAGLGLIVSAGAVATAGPWDSSGQRTAERERAAAHAREGGADHGGGAGTSGAAGAGKGAPEPAPSAASVLAGLGGSTSLPAEKALKDVLGPLLDDPALGPRRTAAVVDVATGKTLYGRGAGDAMVPASTTKIATAAAVLTAAGADHRIPTRAVLQPGSGEVVLVGGGDPTLTARKDAAGHASLRTLADQTAAALKKRHLDEVALSYDASLYEGPSLHPIGVDGNIAPVSALMVDEARLDDSSSGPATRAQDPALSAAQTFAELLKDRGVKTRTPTSAKAARKARTLATVQSPPLSTLVERMLTNSDNDIAEALARQAALATGEPASFEGGSAAVRSELKALGLPLDGVRFADGSGLDRADRLTADLLTALLAEAASAAHPELRPVLTGLPVAGFTGTLRSRLGPDTEGPGLVRAKTGTLTGVSSLAGTLVDADGRLLAFAFLASETTSTPGAQAALDRATAALADCGCG